MPPRRDFVLASAALSSLAASTLTTPQARAQEVANGRPIRVGVMGLSRGQALAPNNCKSRGAEPPRKRPRTFATS